MSGQRRRATGAAPLNRLGNRIVSGAFWSAMETWGRQGALFLTFVILAQYLGPEELGLAALAAVVPGILCIPVVQGFPDALVQRPEIEREHLDSVFWLLLAAGLGLSAGIYLAAPWVAAFFGDPQIEALVRCASPVVAIQALAAVPTAILKRRLDFRLLAARTLAGTLVSGAVGIGMAIAGFGVWSLIGMQLAKVGAEASLLLALSGWRPRLRVSLARFGELSPFALPLVLQSLWTVANEELPKVVLGAFLGPYAVGVYAFARRLLDLLVQGLLSPLTNVALPAISRLQEDPEKVDQFFDTGIRMAGLVGFPAFVGFAAIAPEAVPLLFGAHWAGAVLPVQMLMMLGLLRTVDSLCGLTLLALGYSRLVLALNVAYTALILVALPLGAAISLEAALTAQILCNVVLVPIFLGLAQRVARLDVVTPLTFFPRLAAASGVLFLAVTAWRLSLPAGTPPVLAVGSALVVGIVVYSAMALVLMRSDLFRARETLLRMRG